MPFSESNHPLGDLAKQRMIQANLGREAGCAMAWPATGYVTVTLGVNDTNDDYGIDVAVDKAEWQAFRDAIDGLFAVMDKYLDNDEFVSHAIVLLDDHRESS